MIWDSFKNNKITATIGSMIPLLLLIYLIYTVFTISIRGIPNTIIIVFSVLYIIAAVIYYIIFTIDSLSNNFRVNILPFRAKMIYSQYGSFFLIRTKNNSNFNEYYIYKNKYWIFLNKISDVGINFNGNIDILVVDINRNINLYSNHTNKKNKNKLKEWDGVVDDITRRERTINKIIN